VDQPCEAVWVLTDQRLRGAAPGDFDRTLLPAAIRAT